MWFLLGGSSSFSWCMEWDALFYCDTPYNDSAVGIDKSNDLTTSCQIDLFSNDEIVQVIQKKIRLFT